MADFSIIAQSPQIRSLVQDNALERAFHDALFPRTLFRAEATPSKWPAGVGDVMVFSRKGLIQPDARPVLPGTDPDLGTYQVEQWTSQLNQYGKAIDTDMPTSMVAIQDLFLTNVHQLGLHAAMTMNRLVRNRLYAAGLSGQTVVDTAASSTATIHVARLNGFTRARNPNTANASQVKFDYVSASNPLKVTILDNGSAATNYVIGFIPDNPGDEFGPGKLTLQSNVTNVTSRSYINAVDKTFLVRSGGAQSIDAITSANIPTLADLRSAVAYMRQNNIPTYADGAYHGHLDPTSEAKFFQDTEFQRLFTSIPEHFAYSDFAISRVMNTILMRNEECPVPSTVVGQDTATYDARDPFPGELYAGGTTSGTPVHRVLITGQAACFEYYQDLDQLLTEAGINGKTGNFNITNSSIEVHTDRVQLVIRAPLNRFMDRVSSAWKFIGDWSIPTDACTGGAARYKRCCVIEHGE